MKNSTTLLAALLAVTVLVIMVYLPSLNHMPRSDQIGFLTESMDLKTLPQLIKFNFSFGRARIIGTGDTMLFRPFFWCLLAVERWLIGNVFWIYQAVGIFLHVAVAGLAAGLMWRRKTDTETSGNSYAGVQIAALAFFALSNSNQEMVIWSHVHGYLAMILLLLGSFYILENPRALSRARITSLWAIGFCLSFFYELGQVFSLILGARVIIEELRRTGNRRRALRIGLTFAAIPIIYQAVNQWNLALHPGLTDSEGAGVILSRIWTPSTLTHLFEFLKAIMIQPFFPHHIEAYSFHRLAFDNVPLDRMMRLDWLGVFSYTALISWYGLIALSLKSCIKRRDWQSHLNGLALAVMTSVFIAAFVLGRMNLRAESLKWNTYYIYFPLLAFLLCSLWLWQKEFHHLPKRKAQFFLMGLVLSLPILSMASGSKVFRLNAEYAQGIGTFKKTVGDIQGFIDDHKREPDFSVAFDDFHSIGILRTFGIPHTSIYFREHENNSNPKYIIGVDQASIIVLTPDQYIKRHPRLNDGSLFPQILSPQENFVVYRDKDKYLAVSKAEGSFNSFSQTVTPVVEGNNLEEAVSKAKVAFATASVGPYGEDIKEKVRSFLAGRWLSGCTYVYDGGRFVRADMMVQGSELKVRLETFKDSSCQKRIAASELSGGYGLEVQALMASAENGLIGNTALTHTVNDLPTQFSVKFSQIKPGVQNLQDRLIMQLKHRYPADLVWNFRRFED